MAMTAIKATKTSTSDASAVRSHVCQSAFVYELKVIEITLMNSMNTTIRPAMAEAAAVTSPAMSTMPDAVNLPF
jgi:hypothetical protein